ncbi:DUF4230 domain-containing protein [Subsaximicrobium wynnwilliamsii]|uniref:DUF4230 domain-containing protein n=1 Tax=Subsaximicrobium wynnwilliamsii TaxID=291179 RepID=A0A5C6ZLT2_9FLAO|nr:DUF4230 domain-containing protein [Subsaximicrobium wynnwilliamsii]TXD85399.1 DUF4230 domain-containing protein [Subsaximicrobium wynnwilliamsii]TXD90752.1 DUF4230 domain-containing protein [Subsaximicrobium wynnwilliamsii]TXE05259.1 DUF4230 domain-containing protein [Subsaximicrobium wynnwilliamsii]
MRKIITGILLALVVLLTIKYCDDKNEDRIVLKEHSALIQEQIKNVGKLVVTEGHFSEVFSYKNSKAIFGNLFEVEKKALVVVNADVTVAYDLSKIEYEIDEATKTLRIISIPKEEIKISPDFEYYDVQADYLNQFQAKDYNNIKESVKKSLMKKINASDLKNNAENRLISELSKFYILTNSLGWTLEYNKQQVKSLEEVERFQNLKLLKLK